MDNKILKRWKRAIVHLEFATDSLSWDERHRKIDAAIDEHKNGAIGTDEPSTRLPGGGRDVRHKQAPLRAQNRIPYGRITKATYIANLLAVQETKSKSLT